MVRYQVITRSLFNPNIVKGGNLLSDVVSFVTGNQDVIKQGIDAAVPIVKHGITAVKPIIDILAPQAPKHVPTAEEIENQKDIAQLREVEKANALDYDRRMAERKKVVDKLQAEYLARHPEKAVKPHGKDYWKNYVRQNQRRGGSLFRPYRVSFGSTFGSGISNVLQETKIREVMDLQNQTNDVIRPNMESIRQLIQADKKKKQDEKMKQVINSELLTKQQDRQRIIDGVRKSKELAVSQVKSLLNKNNASVTGDIAEITPMTKTVRAKGIISDILRQGAKKKMKSIRGYGLQVF